MSFDNFSRRFGRNIPEPTVPTGPPARPWTITTAFVALLIGAVLSLFGTFMYLATDKVQYAAKLVEQAQKNNAMITPEQATGIADASVAAAATISGLTTILLALVAWFIFKGRNWARILGLVVVVLLLLSSIISSLTLGVVLAVVAIILTFMPVSSAFFRRSRLWRSSH